MANSGLIIAIDGPAGAGKSTIAREVARQLGYLFINTGAMYRAIAWKARQVGIPFDDREAVGALAARSVIELVGPVDALRVLIDGTEITGEIVRREISEAASLVSAIPAVRRALVARQQEMGARGGVVMEGRDIGTQVFPQADLKIYLDATPEARAGRRYAEDEARGLASSSLAELQQEIEARDHRDKTRDDSPLVQAADAIYLDTSNLTIEEVVDQILAMVARLS
ncbi:MAG: (d)CMP kinase [Acidobacteriota bacterium]